MNCTFIHSFTYTFNPKCANTITLCVFQFMHSYNRTYIYLFLPQGLTQKSATELTIVLKPRTFILNVFLYIHKTSHCYIMNPTFAQLFLVRLTNFSTSMETWV